MKIHLDIRTVGEICYTVFIKIFQVVKEWRFQKTDYGIQGAEDDKYGHSEF